THLVRTRALHEGRTLSAVTADLADALGVTSRILPMSDEAVRTTIRTPDGRLGFQEYFVRDKCQVDVLGVDYDGAAGARPAPGVLEAIRDARLVVVCPSNPVTSVGPILAVPGIADALAATRARVVGVSPIVGGAAVSGPASALMRARGWPVSPVGIARAYAPWLRVMIVAAVPVKDLVNAKQRLVPALGVAERAALAAAMLEDVLAALGAARLDRVWVVTREPAVGALARAGGAEPLAEDANRGHTAA